ncbi:MAG: hypothetical protein Kow0092_39630 [Deferrisomatales bacterium]
MIHIAAGLVLAALGIWGIVAWWSTFGMVMRGVVPFLLLIVGFVAILSGTRRLSVAREGRDEIAGGGGAGNPAKR